MPTLTRTQREHDLLAVGYTRGQAKRIAARAARDAEFAEICALFHRDPTALVAALRARGFDAPARYTRPSRPHLETPCNP